MRLNFLPKSRLIVLFPLKLLILLKVYPKRYILQSLHYKLNLPELHSLTLEEIIDLSRLKKHHHDHHKERYNIKQDHRDKHNLVLVLVVIHMAYNEECRLDDHDHKDVAEEDLVAVDGVLPEAEKDLPHLSIARDS